LIFAICYADPFVQYAICSDFCYQKRNMLIFYQFFSHCFYLIFFPVCHTCIIKLEIQILNLCTLVYIEKQNTNAGVFCILTRFYFEPGNDFWGTKSSCFLQKEGSFAICTRSIVGPVLVLALQLGEKVYAATFFSVEDYT